jgi:hypothetical protein
MVVSQIRSIVTLSRNILCGQDNEKQRTIIGMLRARRLYVDVHQTLVDWGKTVFQVDQELILRKSKEKESEREILTTITALHLCLGGRAQ